MGVSVKTLQKMHLTNQKIAMLTCYDACFASVLASAGVDALLVGDSLGMVMQGKSSTVAVSMDEMIYHTRCVASQSGSALVWSDLPFGAYQCSKEQAFENSVKLMQAGAQMVKLEGGIEMVETVRFLSQRGVPVCGHIGLQPQSVHKLGGYYVQGKSEESAKQIFEAAQMLDGAGASMLLMECVPGVLAGKITAAVSCPTIGIGAGSHCSGQVLVLHDMLNIYPGEKSRFVRNFMQGADSIQEAVASYVNAVKTEEFPALEHTF